MDYLAMLTDGFLTTGGGSGNPEIITWGMLTSLEAVTITAGAGLMALGMALTLN